MENLWNTTVKLNILYHENWTRLASEEIARFQDQLIRTLTDNLMSGSITHTGSADVTGQKIVHYEWNFARAFLYSLTVLTTIGIYKPKSHIYIYPRSRISLHPSGVYVCVRNNAASVSARPGL